MGKLLRLPIPMLFVSTVINTVALSRKTASLPDSEGQWGYAIMSPLTSTNHMEDSMLDFLIDVVYALACMGCFALIGALLAWRG